MRAIWKGAISFGLVNIPITLFPATRREELRFHFLRKSDLSPINNKRVAEADGKEVPWEEIVRGYQYEKGKYVVLNEDDFSRVDIEATQTVDIQEFVELEDIDPVFFSKPYYMEPGKGGDKAYALLRETLRGTGKVGIAKVVIKTREHLAAVKAQKDVLVLELMHFKNEIISSGELNLPGELKIGKKELDMAKQLVTSMTGKWNPDAYKDDYREALLEVIEEKIAAGGKEVSKGKKPAKAKPTNVIDLMSVLQKSIQQHGSSGSKGKAKKTTKAKPKRKAA
jgi:DNA end-binding protein Ku